MRYGRLSACFEMSRLSKLYSENAPLHVDESTAFAEFMNTFWIRFSFSTIVLSYTISSLPHDILNILLDFIGNINPAFMTRIKNLQEFDGRSQFAYGATIAAGVIILIPFMVTLASGYLRTVVYPGLGRAVNAKTILVMLTQAACAILSLYWLFFDPIVTLNQRYPGMSRIFIWPFFPFIGSLGLVLAYVLLFSILAGFLKFVIRKEHENGRH